MLTENQELRIVSRNDDSISYPWVANAYAKAFREDPAWNEWFKTADGTFIGRFANGQDLAKCWRSVGLERAYPIAATAQYIKKETSKPGSVFAVVKTPDSSRITAAGWGFTYQDPLQLVIDKWYSAFELDQIKLARTISKYAGPNPFWYLSEVFVDRMLQGKGRGTKIVQSLIEEAPMRPIIMRTNASSPMALIAKKTGFQQILGPQTIITPEGNLAADFYSIANGLDPINPDRVLYVYQPFINSF